MGDRGGGGQGDQRERVDSGSWAPRPTWAEAASLAVRAAAGGREHVDWTGSIDEGTTVVWNAAWKSGRGSGYGSTSAGLTCGRCGSLRGLWASTPTLWVCCEGGETAVMSSSPVPSAHRWGCHLPLWAVSLGFLEK